MEVFQIIVRLVFNLDSNIITVMSRPSAPFIALLSFPLPTFRKKAFLSHWLHSHITGIVKTKFSIEEGVDPVKMTITSPRKEYWPSRGTYQRLPALKSYILLTELWDSA